MIQLGLDTGEGGEEVPEGYAGADGYVEGVFCAELGDFKAQIGAVNHFRVNAMNLVAGYDCIFFLF